ncbi:bifunctional metallophosphatase/5'-nucleotidase [Salinisphaera aquimarina]|uniref:Bifunctional metallophosphatase/5'-nucleotidase n=1 Tax=Salinisphaera aquimarina TaxID=2094031 RepID=A0ABV7ET53_9GAMM
MKGLCKRGLYKAVVVGIVVALAACSSDNDDNNQASSGDGKTTDASYRLQLLHFSDMDGSTAALDNVSNFSALLNAFESDPELGAHTLVLSSGDNYIPGPRFFAAGVTTDETTAALGVPGNGRGDILFLNALGVAASALGNHDLDPGTEAFAALIQPDADYPGAAFPYLSTNADFSGDPNLADLVIDDGDAAADDSARLAGSAVVSVDGEKIGLVGASTPILASITATGGITLAPSDFTMDDAGYDALAAAIQPAIDALVAKGIDKIILMTHMQQIAIEKALATRLRDADIIIAGGSNTLLADNDDVLRSGDVAADTYPLSFNGPDGSPTLVVNTDGDYKYLGRLVVDFDANGILLPNKLDSTQDGAWASSDAVVEMLANRGLDATASDRVTEIQSALQAVLVDQDGNVQGNTEVFLDGRRTQVRTEETNLGDLSADANLYYARQVEPGVQVSLKNGGGIRDSIGRIVVPPGATDDAPQFRPPQANASIGKPEGGISQFDIGGALRFNNSLTLITITAAELRDVLEHAVAATADGATPGQFPQIGGMRMAFDSDMTARSGGSGAQMNRGVNGDGNRVRTLELIDDAGNVTDTLVEDGALRGDPQRPIRMVLLAFTAQCVSSANYDGSTSECGDAYPLMGLSNPQRVDLDPATVTDPSQVDTAYDPGNADFAASGTEQDALAEYLRAVYPDADNAYATAETPVTDDARIVNLKARRDAD